MASDSSLSCLTSDQTSHMTHLFGISLFFLGSNPFLLLPSFLGFLVTETGISSEGIRKKKLGAKVVFIFFMLFVFLFSFASTDAARSS